MNTIRLGKRDIRVFLVAAAVSALTLAGEAASMLRIESGRVDVVIAPGAPSTVRFAATEMTNLLSQVLGGSVPLRTAPAEGRTSIFLGTNAWSVAAGAHPERLPRDGFVIDVATDVVIAGIDDPNADMIRASAFRGGNSQRYARATLFGVYEFLERFAGVRFYFPGELGTIIPRKRTLDIPRGRIESAPDWQVRLYSHTDESLGAWYEDLPKQQWRLATNLELYRLRMETEHIPCCHGQAQEHLTERFAKTHPEYFHMGHTGKRRTAFDPKRKAANSQLCHTSAVWEEIYKDARSCLLGESPDVRRICRKTEGRGARRREKWVWGWNAKPGKYFDIMPNDGMTKCWCESCQAAYAKAKDPKKWATELIWGNTKRLAERLIEEGVPGYVTQMAYASYGSVPDFPIPTNVLVMVARQGAWSTPRKEAWEREISDIAAWSRHLGRKVWIWNYPGKYNSSGTTIPAVSCSTPHAMGRYLKSVVPYVFGTYQESCTDRFFFQHLPLYVFSRIAWNNSADPEAILDEYNRLMFGAAAKDMDHYIRIQEGAWIDKIVGHTETTEIGPVVHVPSEYDLWTKVYSEKVTDRLAKLLASAEAAVPPKSLEARRIALYRRETFTPLMARRTAFLDSVDAKREKAYRAAHPKAKNIIGNGDFKDTKKRSAYSAGGWIFNRGEIAFDDKVFVSPPYSLRISCTNAVYKVPAQNTWMAYATRKLNGRMKPNTRYRLSYFIRLGNVVPIRPIGGVTVAVKDVKTTLYPERRMHGTTPWLGCSFEFKTPDELPDDKPPLIRPVFSHAYGTIWIDDIRLDELPEETSCSTR